MEPVSTTSLAEFGEISNLIPIKVADQHATVDARNLYGYLEVKTRFNDWVTKRLAELDAVEGQDFYLEKSKTGAGRPTNEYFVRLDLAKEMGMLERNEKGKEVRRYFIAAEKQLQSLQGAALDKPKDSLTVLLEATLENHKAQLALEQRQSATEETAKILTAKVEAITGGSGYFTVRGYANLNGVRIPTSTASQIGRKAGKLARAEGYVLQQAIDELYGAVNSYPETVLERVFEEMGL